MNLFDKATIRAQVLVREVGDETVILDLESGTYYGLDAIGTRIWSLIAAGKNLGEICDVIEVEYDASRAVIEGDLFALLHRLMELGVLEIQSGGDNARGDEVVIAASRISSNLEGS